MNAFTESVVEQAALDWFRALGCDVVGGPDMPPGRPRSPHFRDGRHTGRTLLWSLPLYWGNPGRLDPATPELRLPSVRDVPAGT